MTAFEDGNIPVDYELCSITFFLQIAGETKGYELEFDGKANIIWQTPSGLSQETIT